MKIIFWILVAADIAALFLFFLLGLAAAPASRTSPLAVSFYMLPIPALFILAAILLFTRTTSSGFRGLGVVLAALPWLAILLLRANEEIKLRLTSDPNGKLTYFRTGPLRDMAAAISRNDPATVAALAPQVNINSRGYSGMTPLLLALHQLRETPNQLDCLRAILRARPDPNLGASYESPLETAIQLSPRTGPEPVSLLLAAGANPNHQDAFGAPAYFTAMGRPTDPAILRLLLDHGADIHVRDGNGLSVVFQGANTGNWSAVLLLLQRGAPWKDMRGANSLTLLDTAESYLRVYGDRPGLSDVIAYLHSH